MMSRFTLSCVIVLASLTAAQAQSSEIPVMRTVEGDIDDVLMNVETAIINAGLVIDQRLLVGDMLNRTKADVGGTVDLFTKADVFTFCSAQISREVMEADLMHLQYCPYSIFVYEAAAEPGKIHVGHRGYSDPAMAPVQTLLDGIITDAIGE